VPAGAYHIGIRHRNHLGIVSASPIALNEITQAIDLQDIPLFGTHAAVSLNGKNYLWAGNVNGDTSVIAQGSQSDRSAVLQAVLAGAGNAQSSPNFIRASYLTSDVNLDGRTIFQGIGADATFLLNIILNANGNTLQESNFILNSQLP